MAGVAFLTPQQIYTVARDAGFPTDTAVKMTAIALRESGGKADAFNGNSATQDRSYGLWQINMYGGLAAQRLQAFGITDEKQLLDPVTNAKAAYILWGGNDQNLNTAWAIDKPGYKEKYLSFLPDAVGAAMTVDATGADLSNLDVPDATEAMTFKPSDIPGWLWLALVALFGLAAARRIFGR